MTLDNERFGVPPHASPSSDIVDKADTADRPIALPADPGERGKPDDLPDNARHIEPTAAPEMTATEPASTLTSAGESEEATALLSGDLQQENTPSSYVETRSKDASAPEKKPARPASLKPSTLLEPGPADRLYQVLSWAGLPVLLALAALMCVSELLTVRPLWFSDEVRHADVYMRLLGGDWLTLNLNGVPYPDKPPLYFWFLRALDFLPGVDAPRVFFLGTALSAVLFVGSTWLLARATGHDRREAFAAGLLMLGCLFFGGLAHYPRMDLLFATVIVLSLVCLYRGWIKPIAPLWLTLGFVLAGVATLIKGPLALAFPILPSILFLIVRGTPGRLNSRDGLPGFALMLLLLLAWVAALYFEGQSDYLREIFGPQIAGRMVNAWHHAAPWWYYLAALPLLCLPWTFLFLFINWKVAAKKLPEAWKHRRENGGRLWLWIIASSGFLLLSALSGKIAIYLLPLLSPLAVLTAHALLNLTPRRSRWFFLTVGMVFGLAGAIFLLADMAPWVMPWLPESWTTALPAIARAYLDSLSGLVWMGIVLVGFAILLLRFTRRSLPGGALLAASLGTVCLMQPYAMVVAPALDVMLSPRNQSEAMAKYVAEGYFPAAYRVYPGIYAYYLNDELARLGFTQPTTIQEWQNTEGLPKTNSTPQRPAVAVLDLGDREALDAVLAMHPRIVLALRESDWNKWTDRPADMQLVQRQWIVDQPYVLVVKESAENNAPVLPEITAPEQNTEQTDASATGNTAGSPAVQPEVSGDTSPPPPIPGSPADQPSASDTTPSGTVDEPIFL